jgi:NHL repeat
VNANFRNPASVFADPSGNVYLADQNNHAIRVLTPMGAQPVLIIQSAHGAFMQGPTAAPTR